MREQLIAQLAELIDGSGQLSEFKRGELRGKIAGKPGLTRYLRTAAAGKLRIGTAKIKAEENLDGKYLLRCSDPHLSAEDIAVGYKQLLEVERGWRDMKQVIDLRPVCRDHHRQHLAPHPPRARPAPRRHLHRPCRDIPAAHHPHQPSERTAQQARRPEPQADHRPPARNRLTSADTTA